jgi:hypothetical protein
MLVCGGVYESAADRLTLQQTSAYDPSDGTLVVNLRADDDGATDTPADNQVLEFLLLLDEGAS